MLKHWIWLAQRKGIGHVGRKKLLSVLHSAEKIYEMTPAQYRSLGMKEMRVSWVDSLANKDLREAEKVVADCDRYGIRVISYNDPAYPQRLRNIYDPPCVLYCKGTLPEVDKYAVIGIVGTRRCSNFGLLHTKQISNLVALSGGIVVSGGARGIDTMALCSAMEAAMPVICVLAGGLDKYYPTENSVLFDSIARRGCLLSEHPPGKRPIPSSFVGRNRLISGLSVGLLVTEAPKDSGALTTAELALSQNRDVFTIQAPDDAASSRGNQELIYTGCEVIQDGWDLISRYAHMFPKHIQEGKGRDAVQMLHQRQGGIPHTPCESPLTDPDLAGEQELLTSHECSQPDREQSEPEKSEPEKPKAEEPERPKVAVGRNRRAPSAEALTEGEKRILDILGPEPMEMDAIIMKSGMNLSAATTALTMLQIKKRIIKCFGNSYQRI